MSVDMASAGDPAGARGPHPDLGFALGGRAVECADTAVARLERHGWVGTPPSAHYLQARYEHLWFATLLVARWLVSGEAADAEELGWISHAGRTAALEDLSLPNVARVYLVWRDVLIEALHEEAARVAAPQAALDAAVAVVRRTADGGLIRMTHTFDAHHRALAAALEDERRNLREATLHDQLTGLANRILLYDRVAHAMAQADRDATPLSVLLIDLDGFKAINDSLGHRYGDLVLVELGTRLSRAVRQADTVARLGGDEFVVVLPRTERVRAAQIAEKLLHTLSQPVCVDHERRSLWASVGVAVYPDHGADVDALLLAADHAMYAAKRQGGGLRVCPGVRAPVAREHGAA
jgi:two-component system, sensor histidine kinase LadS